METPIPTISETVLQEWNEISAMWAAETWPTYEEAKQSYIAAEADYELVLFLIPDLEAQIEILKWDLAYTSGDQWEAVRARLRKKHAELVAAEERLVLVMRRREMYFLIFLIARNRKIWPVHLLG